MTTPREEQPPAVPPPAGPTVSTAPPRSRWHWSSVPHHLGRARTSTVVLAVLFVAVAALYLVVRPDPATTVTTGSTAGVPAQPTNRQPVAPTTTPPATTTPRSTTTPPTPTTPTGSATTTASQRTTSASATGSSGSATSTTGGVGSVPTVPTAGSPSG